MKRLNDVGIAKEFEMIGDVYTETVTTVVDLTEINKSKKDDKKEKKK